MLAAGILLAFVRTFEPFFMFIVKKFVYNCFGALYEDTEVLNT